jgi:hypothetical protein
MPWGDDLTPPPPHTFHSQSGYDIESNKLTARKGIPHSQKLEKLINNLKRRCKWASRPEAEMYGHEMPMSTAGADPRDLRAPVQHITPVTLRRIPTRTSIVFDSNIRMYSAAAGVKFIPSAK